MVAVTVKLMVHLGAMAKTTIDVQLLNPFIAATLDCLTQMAGLAPERKRIFIKTDPLMHGYVTGIIGMSNGITGSCTVSFPQNLARHIIAKFMGEIESNLTDEMICDGIGEVANMVAGGAKRHFATTEYRFDISTPTVILGNPTSLHNPGGTISIACEFTASPALTETFLIEVALKPTTVD